MKELDDVKLMADADPKDMLGLVEGLPEQFEKGRELLKDFNLKPSYLKSKPNKIILTGLGGSAIGGDLIKAYFLNEIKIPVLVNRNYNLPACVDSSTLLIVVSYSGNTEETLSAYKEGKQKKAQMVALTTGGKLLEMCKKDSIATHIIPAGFPPRASIGLQFAGLVGILEKLGLSKDKSKDFKEMIQILKSMRKDFNRNVPTKENLAKKLAKDLVGRIPVIYATQDLNDVVALRWKDQINENGKAFAFNNIFPELNHNEIVGWEFPKNIIENFSIIMIRDKQENPQVRKRFKITAELLKDIAYDIFEFRAMGDSLLARLFSAIYLGDYVSVYLALLYGTDPTPVKRIEELKKQLV